MQLRNIGGFAYQNRLREASPSSFYPKQVARLARFLDNPAAWRARWYVAPEIQTDVDPNGGQLIKQVQMRADSYVVGLQASALTGTLANFTVQVRWDFDGTELFSSPVDARLLAPSGGSQLPQILLPEPKLISGDAVVSVFITNNDTAAHALQFVLKALEPIGL